MAIVQNPLINRASGAVGNSVFSKWKDRNVLKSKSINPYPSPSPAQVAARAIFKNCIDFQLPIKPYWPYICKSKKNQLSPCNFFVKQNRNLFTAGTDIILVPSIVKLNFSYGVNPTMRFNSLSFNYSLSYAIYFDLPFVSNDDLFPDSLLIYCVDSYTKLLHVFLSDGPSFDMFSFDLPPSCLGHVCYFFASFHNSVLKSSSISIFCTSLEIN